MKYLYRSVHSSLNIILLLVLALSACHSSPGNTSLNKSTTSGSSAVSGCSGDTDMEITLCATQAFLDTLSTTERQAVILDWNNPEAKTVWSNLPGVTRNGLRLGDLNDASRAAAMAVARSVLTDDGYQDFIGVLAADDYLNEAQLSGQSRTPTGAPPDNADGMPVPDGSMPPPDDSMPPPGDNMPSPDDSMPSQEDNGAGVPNLSYSSDNYYIAFIGQPSVDGNWMLQIGGHHLAYNITFLTGTGYPVPNHVGVEPKSSFEINSASYAPLADEGNAMVAMFSTLSETQLANAYLEGQSYSDVLVGPDNGSGVLPGNYPTGDDRKGILVSSLNASQQAVVVAAIRQWVADYVSNISDHLLNEYTSDTAFKDTYIAWAGDKTAGIDVDTAGTYMRIDGPHLWIEIACQSGVVLSGTHYHTMFRDKTMDYGSSL